MKTLSVIGGLIGIVMLLAYFWVGVAILIISALAYSSASGREKAELEERRHQELLEATRERNRKL